MGNNILSKGSVWRKWDLQIHTPETKLADQYKANEDIDVWDKFVDCLKKSDVSVFGVADYFSVDGYVKLLEKIKGNKDLSKIKQIKKMIHNGKNFDSLGILNKEF